MTAFLFLDGNFSLNFNREYTSIHRIDAFLRVFKQNQIKRDNASQSNCEAHLCRRQLKDISGLKTFPRSHFRFKCVLLRIFWIDRRTILPLSREWRSIVCCLTNRRPQTEVEYIPFDGIRQNIHKWSSLLQWKSVCELKTVSRNLHSSVIRVEYSEGRRVELSALFIRLHWVVWAIDGELIFWHISSSVVYLLSVDCCMRNWHQINKRNLSTSFWCEGLHVSMIVWIGWMLPTAAKRSTTSVFSISFQRIFVSSFHELNCFPFQ